jgi:hypothetical protein
MASDWASRAQILIFLEATEMKTRIVGALVLGFVLAVLYLPFSQQLRSSQLLQSGSAGHAQFTTDGAVLPLLHGLLVADGGGPAPPLPPASIASLPASIPQSPLLADGGGPAPPLPPVGLMLSADGGGPAPPLPPASIAITA